MAEYIYIDFSNLSISARFIQGKQQDQKPTVIYDHDYTIDFNRLYFFLAGADRAFVKRCILFSSDTGDNEDRWAIARKAGFGTYLPHREIHNEEKMVDTALVTYMIKVAYTVVDKNHDVITLVSGDSDFVPPLKVLREDGYHVEVCFWDTADWELIAFASKFIALNAHLSFLALKPKDDRKVTL